MGKEYALVTPKRTLARSLSMTWAGLLFWEGPICEITRAGRVTHALHCNRPMISDLAISFNSLPLDIWHFSCLTTPSLLRRSFRTMLWCALKPPDLSSVTPRMVNVSVEAVSGWPRSNFWVLAKQHATCKDASEKCRMHFGLIFKFCDFLPCFELVHLLFGLPWQDISSHDEVSLIIPLLKSNS